MRITRTPFRISFLGGGSDYPEWHREHMGMVLGAAIDKYCYITFQDNQESYRIFYSTLEECAKLEQIHHPAIKACLEYLWVKDPVSVTHASDLHSRSGVGSSSAFVVGLLNAIAPDSKEILANAAIEIEQEILQEPVGSQDQILCAYGGINQIAFHPTGVYGIRQLELTQQRIDEFRSHLMLFYIHPRGKATPIPLTFDLEITRRLATMAKEGTEILLGDEDIIHFGELLHEGWELKKQMSPSISTLDIDDVYAVARRSGAIGGKILGAGGGGFMLLFAEPRSHQNIKHALRNLRHIDFKFDYEGSKVIYNG